MILIRSICQKVINLRTHQRFAREMLNTEYYLVWVLWAWMAFQQVMLQRRVLKIFNSKIQFLIFSHSLTCSYQLKFTISATFCLPHIDVNYVSLKIHWVVDASGVSLLHSKLCDTCILYLFFRRLHEVYRHLYSVCVTHLSKGGSKHKMEAGEGTAKGQPSASAASEGRTDLPWGYSEGGSSGVSVSCGKRWQTKWSLQVLVTCEVGRKQVHYICGGSTQHREKEISPCTVNTSLRN